MSEPWDPGAAGYPSASLRDEEAPRCPVCGGYYDEDGRCSDCGLDTVEADEALAGGPS